MVLRDCGQSWGDPSGVVLQSRRRMRAPISPPPARNEAPDTDESLSLIAAATTRAILVCSIRAAFEVVHLQDL
jgi:hypothetical protein